MDLPATQIYEDEDFSATQRISYVEEEELIQVGTLSINSIEYQIKKGITKIGRLNSCDIVINDPTISKVHAEIEAASQVSTWICDLQSSNKTKLNNLVLRPTRSYELKDKCTIEFGKVRATYRVYRPADNTDDTVIPETPAPTRQKILGKIIPNTPDSSVNNSSIAEDNGSVILGTQKDDERSRVFRRPLLPSCQSASKKAGIYRASLIGESEDSQIDLESSRVSESNTSEEVPGVSIHDVETQEYFTNPLGYREASVAVNKRLSKLNERTDAVEGSSRDAKNINKRCSESDIQDTTSRTFVTDIHDLETQKYVNVVAKKNSDSTRKPEDEGETQTRTEVERDIHNLETQLPDDIYDAETQLGLVQVTSKTTDTPADKVRDTNNDTFNDGRNGTSYEDERAAKSPSSRCSSSRSLNLSSPGVDEDCPSSPSNRSVHLLESSELLEYFGDGLDKTGELADAPTPEPLSKAKKKLETDNSERSVANASDSESNDDNIFDVPTQRINDNFENLLSDDFETDEVRRVSVSSKIPKKGCKRPRPKQTDDGSETDAEECLEELVKKQDEFLKAANKSSHDESTENKNDPGTSIESDDMFDMPTQRSINRAAKDSVESSSIGQRTNSNKRKSHAVVGDTASTQKRNVEDKNDRGDRSPSADISDMPTQLILPCEALKVTIDSKCSSSKSNQDDVNDTAVTQLANAIADEPKLIDRTTPEDLDCEDIDYELAPTQVIGEVTAEGSTKRVSARNSEKSEEDLNDTLERNLNEMFDGANCDDIDEAPLMSTQYLEEILQSSQYDNSLSATGHAVNGNAVADNAANTKSRKRTQSRVSHDYQISRKLLNIGIGENDANDSHDSDIYFSTMTTNKKKNIIRDSQDFTASAANTTSFRRDAKSKERAKNDDALVAKKKEAKGTLTKSKKNTDVTTSSDSAKCDAVNNTVSSEGDERSVRSLRSAKRKNGGTSKANERVALGDSREVDVDNAERRLASSESNVCVPCPSLNRQGAETSDVTYESDDDILTRLPAVRISGTLSNPPSPSESTTSISNSSKSRQDSVKGANEKDKPLSGKSLPRRNAKNLRQEDEKHSISSTSKSSNSKIPETEEILKITSTSKDLNREGSYKRFKQMADRMLSNELSYVKNQIEIHTQSANKLVDRKRSASPANSDALSKSEQREADNVESSGDPSRIGSRATRRSSRRNNENPCVFQVTKEARAKDAVDRSKSSKMKSADTKKKRGRHTIEESAEENDSKRHKANISEEHPVVVHPRRNAARTAAGRESPNLLEYVAETRSRSNSPVIGYTKSSVNNKAVPKVAPDSKTRRNFLKSKAVENINTVKSSAKRELRSKHRVNDVPAAVHDGDVTTNENSNSSNSENKQVPVSKKEKQINELQVKLIRIQIETTEKESQEVEMIMKNASDESSLSEKRDGARMPQRESRRNRKRLDTIVKTNSAPTESNVSSDASCFDSAQSEPVAPRAKRGRSAKNATLSLQVPTKKQEEFKKPVRVGQHSAHSVVNTSAGSSISGDSSDSMEKNTSSYRLSKTKAARAKKTEQVESNRSTRGSRNANDSISSEISTSTENAFYTSTPTRASLRRSTSSLSNSSLSVAKHKVLFTGITEDYGKVVKMLGGVKVEDLAKCTVLVTDKVRRTYKFLCALAQGVPIVTIDWLKDSESMTEFLNWDNYILKDPAAEAKFGFRLRKSLDTAKKRKLLDGYTIVITPNIAPPPVEELKDMVTSCGGKVLLRPPTRWPEKAVIVSRKEDLSNAKKYLAKAPKTVTVQSTEFILTGILRQEVVFDKYNLLM